MYLYYFLFSEKISVMVIFRNMIIFRFVCINVRKRLCAVQVHLYRHTSCPKRLSEVELGDGCSLGTIYKQAVSSPGYHASQVAST